MLPFWSTLVQPRLWLLTIALLGVPICLWWHGIPSRADTGPGKTLVPSASPFVGAGSCAAAACHNGNFVTGDTGSEFTIWITRDRHAKAYEVLFLERSLQIQKNLGRDVPAHQDQRCLMCHVAPQIDPSLEKKAPYFRTDGVSCESCHGGAENWLNVHHLPAWKRMTPAAKKALGMNDTQSLVSRTQVCVTCHVGTPGMEVDHDLIAAGHPRLAFEMSAFHAFMPHHWPDSKDRDPTKSPRGRTDFEARGWVVGQLVTAQASLELLADRAGAARKVWPEFAHHDCVACHHELRSPSGYPQRAGKPGAVPWSAWDLGMTHQALQAIQADPATLANLHKELDKGWNNRQAIAKSARLTAQQLKTIIEALDPRDVDSSAWLDTLQKTLVEDTKAAKNWDQSAQIGLALAAIQRSSNAPFPDAQRQAIQEFTRKLELTSASQRSANLDSDAIRQRLIEFKNRGAGKEF
jgi:hypothetical protein